MTDSFINGQWFAGQGHPLESIDPGSGEVIWAGRSDSDAQVAGAMDVASSACAQWAGATADERIQRVRRYGAYLDQHGSQLAELISREIGKPLWESSTEVAACIGKVQLSIDAFCERRADQQIEMKGAQARQTYRPLGVMAVLGPFNFPAHLPGGQIIPALLAGNSVVFKPSEQAPATGRWLTQAWEQCELPDGVFQMVQGGPAAARAMVDHKSVAGVLFTGSYRAGQSIHQQLAGRPEVLLALEMGGNNGLIVKDPLDVDAAIELIIQSAFITSGQRCTCARRLIVVETSGTQDLIDRLSHATERIRIGTAFDDPPPFMGPVVSEAAADSVRSKLTQLAEAGGVVLYEDQIHEHCPALVGPSLIDMTGIEAADEECFGPLLQVFRVPDFDTAIQQLRTTRYGLASGLIGGTREDFERLLRHCRSGVVNWNRPTTGASGRLAFGGIGFSGNHRPAGYFASDFCSDPVSSLEADSLCQSTSLPPGLEKIH